MISIIYQDVQSIKTSSFNHTIAIKKVYGYAITDRLIGGGITNKKTF